MKLIFMGTPDFAVKSLEKLVNSSHEVLAVVTQPDRMRDKCKVSFSPVKEFALKHGIKVLQYEKVSKEGIEDIV
ncbi:MAG: methionyl-tRNA formyltransferase, partial [Clostridia bacterium]